MVYVVIMAWHGTTHGMARHMALLFAALLAIATTTT